HVYTSSGNFSVSLVVEGPGGFDAEFKFEHVTVGVPLVADFTATPLSGVEPLNVVFSDQSTGSPTSWDWDFGDMGTSTLQNPTHTYAVAGSYTVRLTAANSAGPDTETKIGYITVGNTPPVAQFSGTPLSGDAPLSVTFTDLSTGVVTGWFWTFGDGGTSTLQNPTHNYTIDGTYTVILTATGPGGDGTETKPNYITVNVPAPPSANFIGAPLIGPQPLSVAFTDLSQGAVTAWAWSFEGGGTSNEQHPTQIFNLFGTYTVTLTATGPGGPDTEEKVDYVVVLPPPPIVDFSAIPTSGIVPLTVFFSDTSAGVAVSSWSWDFGDSGTSTDQNPSHTYDAPGTYTVSLTATNAGGSGTETKLDFISVEALPFGDGSFELQTAGLPPDLPWIVTSGSGHVIQPGSGPTTDNGMPVEGAQWALVSALGTNAATPPTNPGGLSFPPVGAAGFAQSFAFDPDNPVLIFNAAFILFGPQASTTMNDFMSVDVTNGVAARNLYYADTFSAFPNTSTRFGLPMTDVEAVGVHLATIFPNAVAGDTITLAIQTGNGGDATLSSMGYVDDIFLRNEARATYRNGRGINPPCYIADPPILGSLWTAQIDHRDLPTANFVVILIRRDQVLNGPNTTIGEVLVGGATVLDFPAVANPAGITTVQFPVPLNLSLMGLGASQGLIVGQTFCNAVDFELGFQPTAPIPAADFSATPTSGPAPLPVSFTDLTTGPVTSWNWDFGDGAVSTLASPTNTYTVPGTYTVFLRVSGPGGLDIERKFDLVVAQ
ncbi:MAG: hypothetical protein CMJ89_07885, partial [Planctomycetes bacterium]|nr:hypothetical protein [Planctomycetota bacterium]